MLSRAPGASYWLIAVAALIWNLFGAYMFYLQMTATPESLAEQYSAAELAFIESIPSWAMATWGIAVAAGALGSLLLIGRRKLAMALFVVSLLAIIVQNAYNFGVAGAYSVFGAGGLILPAIVIVVALGLIVHTRRCSSDGLLA